MGVAEQPNGQLDVVRLDASMPYGEVDLTILSLVSMGLMVRDGALRLLTMRVRSRAVCNDLILRSGQ